jgi:hypothetical protein
MFNFADSYVRKYVISKIISDLPEINVIPGECHYNFQCHHNSAHYALKNKHNFLTVGFYIDNNYPIIHFLNYINNDFVDNTLGEHTVKYKHYFLKKIHKEDFHEVDNIFGELRKEIRNKLPWHLKLFSKYNC